MNKVPDGQAETTSTVDTNSPKPAIISERALIGALVQDFDSTIQVCQKENISHSSFTDAYALNAWTAAMRLNEDHKIVDLVTVSERMTGDPIENMLSLGEMVSICPSVINAAIYAKQVSEAENRQNFYDIIRISREKLKAGGNIDAIAEQLKTAIASFSEAHKSKSPSIVSATDFTSKPIPEPPIVIHGLLRARQVGMMSAGSKAGKSWGLLSLSCAVASGKKWLGKQTSPGRCLYINAELSEYDLQQRLERISVAMGLDSVPSNLDIWHIRGTHTTIGKLIPAIERRQADVGLPYSLIVPDPLYSFHGDRDENSNSEMAISMGELSELTERTGSAIWISHHFAKGSQSGKDHLDRGSGAGVLSRSPDTIMTLTAHKDDDCYSVETTCRSFSRPDSFVVRWEYPLWVVEEDLDPTELRKPGSGRPTKHDPDQILGLLPHGGLSHTDWREVAEERLGMKKSAFNSFLAKAKSSGTISMAFGRYIRADGHSY